jgi:hypothetical protein
MSGSDHLFEERTPGVEEHESTASYLTYTVGLGLAIIATIGSFVRPRQHKQYSRPRVRRIDRLPRHHRFYLDHR